MTTSPALLPIQHLASSLTKTVTLDAGNASPKALRLAALCSFRHPSVCPNWPYIPIIRQPAKEVADVCGNDENG